MNEKKKSPPPKKLPQHVRDENMLRYSDIIRGSRMGKTFTAEVDLEVLPNNVVVILHD